MTVKCVARYGAGNRGCRDSSSPPRLGGKCETSGGVAGREDGMAERDVSAAEALGCVNPEGLEVVENVDMVRSRKRGVVNDGAGG